MLKAKYSSLLRYGVAILAVTLTLLLNLTELQGACHH